MPHTLRINPLHTRAPRGPRVPRQRTVALGALRLAVVVPEHANPLLSRLLVVLGEERGVGAAVVDLHLRAGAGVPRVHGLDDVGPLRGRVDGLALRARAVPGVDAARGGDEAAGGDARVGNGGLEELGVGGGEDVLQENFFSVTGWGFGVDGTYGHHGAGARARHKHLAGVGAVLADSVGDHVGDRVAVAAAVVRQGRLGADVPAGAAVRAAGVDDDEAVLLGQLRVRRAIVVGLGGAGAVVADRDNTMLVTGLRRFLVCFETSS